ncbi:GumC family protein [Qipengyuania flava]|uniref:GumC family protein n=1 Tax=Qipengyuania flava TaxID=192812 RepID=UPI001C6308BB|nr:polysaccharide biosynthesis tyrosine autokinase [Qipengyuania flava]QYJ06371.1 polysaccharide biosynthesis tyrosine autokinase [Qipengyuania flava]
MVEKLNLQPVDAPVQPFGETYPGAGGVFDLHAIMAAVRRNIIPIVAIVVGALILAVVATLLMVPRYIASSRVMIEQQAEQIIENDTATSPAAYQDADRFLQTQVDIIRSRTLAQQVVEAEGLASDAEFFEAQGAELPTEEDVEGLALDQRGLAGFRQDLAIDLVQDNMNAGLPLDSRIVTISFESADPVIAARLSNALSENFINGNLVRKFESSAYAREFLAQQLADAREKLETSERDLNQYSRQAGLIRVSGQGQNADRETTLSVTNDTLVQLNAAASAATAERVDAENRWQAVINKPVLSVPQVVQNPGVQSLISQRSQIEAELADERQRHLDDHPNVKALEAQLARINDQIQSVGSAIKDSLRVQYESTREREQQLRSQVTTLRDEALGEQDRGVQYNVLKRVAETDRALYNTLLTRYNELNAIAGATSNNLSLIDVAEVPREPSSPNLALNVLVALVAGLAAAGAFVFLREQLDDVIRSPDDVENKLKLSMLGLIPQADNLQEDLQDPKSPVSEAYQSLGTNLRYSSANGMPASLMITSGKASEGKSTTANELARQFASLGRRTLLVDADLRRPTLHKRIGSSVEGLTSVLAGEKRIEEVIVPSDIANLSYMTALPIPPDPAALLGSPRLEETLSQIKESYDCVIIDAPPLLGLSDTPLLSANVEAIVMVIDASSGTRGVVKAGLRRLNLVHANVLGAVLTRFDAKAAGGSYSYYGSDYYTYESREA